MSSRWLIPSLAALGGMGIACAFLWPIAPHPGVVLAAPRPAPVLALPVSATIKSTALAPTASSPAKPVMPREPRSPRMALAVPSAVHVGDQVDMTLDADVPDGASDFAFTFHYDATAWRFVSATPGRYMEEASVLAKLHADAQSLPGVVTVTLDQDGGAPTSGSGSLVVLSFEAIAAAPASRIGVSDIAITSFDRKTAPAIAVSETTVRIDPRPR